MPHHYRDVGDVGRRPEPVLHYSTRKQDEAAEATPRSIYDEKFLQLDKKTGQEHGRLSERERASSGFSSASSAGREPPYPRQTRRSGGHGYERDAEWHLDDYNHRRGGDRYARSDGADSRRARGYYQPYDSHLRRDEEEWRQQQQRGHASRPAYDSADRGYYGERDGRYHRSYGDEDAYPWPADDENNDVEVDDDEDDADDDDAAYGHDAGHAKAALYLPTAFAFPAPTLAFPLSTFRTSIIIIF